MLITLPIVVQAPKQVEKVSSFQRIQRRTLHPRRHHQIPTNFAVNEDQFLEIYSSVFISISVAENQFDAE